MNPDNVKWYVLHTYSGYESMVKDNLEMVFQKNNLTDRLSVGEIVPDSDGEGICALYNASLDDVEIRADSSPLKLAVYTLGNRLCIFSAHSRTV